ncbi:MAG TPA: hypothetical protein IAC02_07435 [Candidatus Coprovivens excrementavium]|nr:hypothetical protein [Candidatus Coprovivens excrementavium]
MSKEQFKEFVQKNPHLADYVENNTMTWQKFYELYDMYGENKEIWQKYLNKNNRNINNFFDKVDPDAIQKHIESAQKALDIFSEIANKTSENITNNIKPSIERPLSKFFGD